MNSHHRERRDLIKQRNKRIREDFWKRYEELEGRHLAKVEVVSTELSGIYFLSPKWIRRIINEEW